MSLSVSDWPPGSAMDVAIKAIEAAFSDRDGQMKRRAERLEARRRLLRLTQED